ncbi:MAG: hypothetical protein VX764_07890 [Planctomycetota bacterium]|nr:hypothetical protein [Planctomycetota bacterium]
MFNADMPTRTVRLVLLSIFVFAVVAGGCNTGHRFGAGFGDPVTGPPEPPPPVDCISPSLTSVTPEQGAAGTQLSFTGVNFSDQLAGNRVVFRSFSNNTVLEGLPVSVNVDTSDPDACGFPSVLQVIAPGGVRSGTVELFVNGVFAGAGVFTASPEIVGFAVGDEGVGALQNAAGSIIPDTVVLYGYNLNGVTGASVDDGTNSLASPSVQGGTGNVDYDLPPDMEAVRVEMPTGILPSGDTSALGITLSVQTTGFPLTSSTIDVPLATLLAPGELSDVPPYITAGLMPAGVRGGEIPLQFAVVCEPVRGRFDAVPEFEDPAFSDNWFECTAVEGTFDGHGFVPGSFGFAGQIPFAINAGHKLSFLWDSSVDLPDGLITTRIRLQLADPVPATAATDTPGVWVSGLLAIQNDSAGSAIGEVVETFDSIENLNPLGGGAIWGGGTLLFNAVAPETNQGAISGDGTVDVILQADRIYDMNQSNGSIFDITEDPPIEILPAGSVPGEFQMRSFVLEQNAIVQFSGPADIPIVIRCSGTGDPEDIVFLLAGDLDLSGGDGAEGTADSSGDGGVAGPGGGSGGSGSSMEINGANQLVENIVLAEDGEFGGEAGGSIDLVIPASIYSTRAGNAGGGGGGVAGFDGINTFSFDLSNRSPDGTGGSPTMDSLGIQLRGGGGGGGGGAGTRRPTTTAAPVVNNGGGGGGGGGALGVVVDGSVRLTGEIQLAGGNGQRGVNGTTAGAGGGGGGGTFVLRATGNLEVGATAVVNAAGGEGGVQLESPNGTQIQKGGKGADGMILFETNGSLVAPGTLEEASLLPPLGVGAGTSYGVSSGLIDVGTGTNALVLDAANGPYTVNTDTGIISDGVGSTLFDNGGNAGTFEFSQFELQAGAVLTGVGSDSLFIRSTGTVDIAGVIDVSGGDAGVPDLTDPSVPVPGAGGFAGPGGGDGGGGGLALLVSLIDGEDGGLPVGIPPDLIDTGVPPGGDPGETVPPNLIAAATGGQSASGSLASCTVGGGGGGGYAAEGNNGSGAGSCTDPEFPEAGQGGSSYGAASFLVPDPLDPEASISLHVGGLGGAGGAALYDTDSSTPIASTGGGGGGGYIEITANGPMVVAGTAQILALGGDSFLAPEGAAGGGGGAGGAIRIRGRSVVIVEEGAILNVSGGFANQEPPGGPYPIDNSTSSGGGGAEGWVRVETPLGFSDSGIDVVPSPIVGTFSVFEAPMSSAASIPYSLVSDNGSLYSNLLVEPLVVDLASGSPANLQILYEGYGLSDSSAGGVGPLVGIVSDPALLRDPQSVVLRFFLFQDVLNPGFTPIVDGVSVSFDELPPPPPPPDP